MPAGGARGSQLGPGARPPTHPTGTVGTRRSACPFIKRQGWRRTAIPNGEPSMIRDGTLVCDGCQKTISRITHIPEEGWPNLRNLCSACFAELWKKSIPLT